MIGVKRARSHVDEGFISALKRPDQPKLNVMDSRPQANAVANMLRGGGYELAAYYKDVELEFNNIHNIHVMRNSLRAVTALCQSPPKTEKEWRAELKEAKWLEHIRLVLLSAQRVVQLVDGEQQAVMVHCSDGYVAGSRTIVAAAHALFPARARC